MKKLAISLFLLPSLCLGIEAAQAKSPSSTKMLVESPLPAAKVWVINQQQQVQRKPFMWVVEKPQTRGQQPFLEISQELNQPRTKAKSDKPSKNDDLEAFDEIIQDTQKLDGIFTLYRHKEKQKIYLEIKPNQLQKNFFATATLESGIGEGGIYSGIPLQDFLFYFQRVDNNLQFIIRNVNFRTKAGDPQARSLMRSFSDSVLYSIPIKSIHPQRQTLLIDVSDLLLTDLSGLATDLQSEMIPEQSYLGNAQVFPENLEIESVFRFASNSIIRQYFNSLPDSRSFTLRVHYSFSQLPVNNYIPRLADERVGYFLTAYQDLSRDNIRDPFVRYINRWYLEKQDPTAAISPPKKPIVFWIDNAVPYEYRDAIKQGILMWNQAFLKAGFKDAIEVKQMPDNATWNPADIRYNTIRWINTVDGYFALGPSRVNPITGEILDADILIDGSFLRLLKNEYRQLVEPNQHRSSLSAFVQNRLLCNQNLEAQDNQNTTQLMGRLPQLASKYDLCYGIGAANQFTFGSLAISLLQTTPTYKEQMQDYIQQYLRLIVAHEVGHTLGLRHNFRGSTFLTPEEINNPEITSTKGLTASVMDYISPTIAPQGVKQGEYFPSKVGSYDEWAIEYGYTPTQAKIPLAEKPFLESIAAQSSRPELSYSTDEDLLNSDPTVDAWDNSSNVLIYSQWQLDNSRRMWEVLNKSFPVAGESYSDVSERFQTILINYLQQVYYTIKYIGGQSFYRVNPQEKRLPFVPVPLEKQRQALATLQKYVFAEDALQFPPQLLNKLAPSRWLHWGTTTKRGRLDYPIHDTVLFIQSGVLRDLLSGDRLTRLKDMEFKTPPGQALTLPELFDTLQTGIWTEIIKPQQPTLKISSLRRGLQREYLNILAAMVLRKDNVPEDARTLAWYKLKQLNSQIKKVNTGDEYTKAHLLESSDRIEKILNAPLPGN
ncbi:MAG TPA: zinc-dependent metalloprotease [Nostocaceae cyanobacterium]|nr:zinc-dependent metalloprotease [Nostocaceae cyanobacterium]